MKAWVFMALLGGCTGQPQAVPDEEPVRPASYERRTQVGRYSVSVRLMPDPPVLGELFQVQATVWDNRLEKPLETGVVTLDARMPQHDHGMETRPRVRPGVCPEGDTDPPSPTRCPHPDGVYVADGFKFHMSGDWTLMVGVDGPSGQDSTTIVVNQP